MLPFLVFFTPIVFFGYLYLTNPVDFVAVYNLDPDFSYIGQAIEFLGSSQVYYIGHPGVPSIMAYALFLLPIKIYANAFYLGGFGRFFVDNFSEVIIYLRIVNVIIFATALLLLFSTLKKWTQNSYITLLACLIFCSFSWIWFMPAALGPESFSFLFAVFWVKAALNVSKSQSSIKNWLLLSFASGLVLANKLTNSALVFCTFAPLFIMVQRNSLKSSFKVFSFMFLTFTFSFFALIWPGRKYFSNLFSWIERLALSSSTHGRTGGSQVIDLSIFWQSIKTFFFNDWQLLLGALLCIVFFFFSSKNEEKMKKNFPVIVPFLGSGILFFLLFSKYPLSHYQTINVLLIVAGSILLLDSIDFNASIKKTVAVFCAIYFFFQINPAQKFRLTFLDKMEKQKLLSEYLKTNPNEEARVWQLYPQPEVAMIWTNHYANWRFSREIEKKVPKRFLIYDSFQLVQNEYGHKKNVNNICWDQAILERPQIAAFKDALNDSLKANVIELPVPGIENLFVLKTSDCNNNPTDNEEH